MQFGPAPLADFKIKTLKPTIRINFEVGLTDTMFGW